MQMPSSTIRQVRLGCGLGVPPLGRAGSVVGGVEPAGAECEPLLVWLCPLGSDCALGVLERGAGWSLPALLGLVPPLEFVPGLAPPGLGAVVEPLGRLPAGLPGTCRGATLPGGGAPGPPCAGTTGAHAVHGTGPSWSLGALARQEQPMSLRSCSARARSGCACAGRIAGT
jgi:hypothetical protein